MKFQRIDEIPAFGTLRADARMLITLTIDHQLALLLPPLAIAAILSQHPFSTMKVGHLGLGFAGFIS